MFNFNLMRGFRGGSPMQQQASNPFMRMAAGQAGQPVAQPAPAGNPADTVYTTGQEVFQPGGKFYNPNVQSGPITDFEAWFGPQNGDPAQNAAAAALPNYNNAPSGAQAGILQQLMQAMAQRGAGGGMGGSQPGAAMPPAPSGGLGSALMGAGPAGMGHTQMLNSGGAFDPNARASALIPQANSGAAPAGGNPMWSPDVWGANSRSGQMGAPVNAGGGIPGGGGIDLSSILNRFKMQQM